MLQFEYRENIKLWQKLGKSASETVQMIKQALPEGKPYGTFLHISFSSVSSSYTNVGRLP
jgi:hypothetical protein